MTDITVRRVRQSIPSGYVLGRTSAGTGPVEAIHVSDLATALANTGGVVSGGGSNSGGQQWSAGAVTSLAGLTIVNGVLTVSLAAGAGIVSVTGGTIVADWQAGSVTAVGTGLTLATGGTLEVSASSSGRTYALPTAFSGTGNTTAASTKGCVIGPTNTVVIDGVWFQIENANTAHSYVAQIASCSDTNPPVVGTVLATSSTVVPVTNAALQNIMFEFGTNAPTLSPITNSTSSYYSVSVTDITAATTVDTEIIFSSAGYNLPGFSGTEIVSFTSTQGTLANGQTLTFAAANDSWVGGLVYTATI